MTNSIDKAIKHFADNQKIYFTNTQQIEHAIALHEKGNRIEPSISFYTKLYADLVDRSAQVGKAIAQNGSKVDPEVLKAHRELDAKLSSLSLRVAIASQPPLGLSKGAKMGCYALAAGIAAAAAYYLGKTWPTEETAKRVFDIGLGVKEEILDTSRCTRAMSWNRDITRTCITTRSTVNPDSLNQWLAGTKTCIDLIPSSSNANHWSCEIPLWDPAEKSDLLRKGEEWIKNEEWRNCSPNALPAQVECSIPPKDSPFRTNQAKKTSEAYRKVIDQHCKDHLCQRIDTCNTGKGCGCSYHFDPAFARTETQEELLKTIWNQITYSQTPERVRAIALENALKGDVQHYRNHERKWTPEESAKSAQDSKDRDACEKTYCDGRTPGQSHDEIQFNWAYCMKTACAEQTRNDFEKFYALPTEFGQRFWSAFPEKTREFCPAQTCEISNDQIIDAAEVLRMQLLGASPEMIERFSNDNACNRYPKKSG